MTRVPNSMKLYQRAGELIAGKTHLFGRRAELNAYGIAPIYSDRLKAGRFWDVDGHEYIDFNLGAGAVLLGHAYPSVVRAVQEQAARGTGLTVNHPLEIETAELLSQIVPCAEMVRFCKGGGEADMVAVRIARAATGRDKVVFCGYHGWHDWYISANLTSATTLEKHLLPGITPLGVPKSLAGTAFPFEYNNLDSLKAVLEANRGEVACVIMEAARTFTPAAGFLEGVRNLTRDHGVVLIFDEVVTGFRVARGGAQECFSVKPDMATFAKCISNGFALGAVVGKKEIMQVALDSFISSVYWAEATGLAAGKATLTEYLQQDVSGAIRQFGEAFMEGCRKVIAQCNVPMKVMGLPSFPSLVFEEVDTNRKDQLVTLYMQETAKRGLFGGPGHFFCLQHTEADLKQAHAIIGEALTIIAKALTDGDPLRYLECPVRQSGFRRLV
ncbi:MAG: aminotransferase class III-fold pyridoxal phosphate-dependent enzyme [Acidobacteria bacterium]|nr:aminotransferase class III-fold pyridoxal phosphate-dependent enzyme [Acidobacteriota bacterium]